MIGFRKLAPLGNRLLIKKAEAVTQSAGGILLHSKDKSLELNHGTVVQVGPGRVADDGTLVPVSIKVGQEVLLPEWGGSAITLADDSEFHIYREDDIIGILSEKTQ